MQSQQKAGLNPLVFLLVPALAIVLLVAGQPPGPAPQVGVPVTKMLEDPEAQTEEFFDHVNAFNQATAMKKCRDRAEFFSMSGGRVVTLLSARYLGNGLYECKFKGEVNEYADDK